jgi:beta-xylosidase
MTNLNHMTQLNPILKLDYPDPDVIRVGEIYYMISTTMYFMPGGEILRSYDLIHWEHAAYVYDTLDHTPGQTLTDAENAYGQGMWAATIRYHRGSFYVCFVANDTGKTYLYTAKEVGGPWERKQIQGFYHDCSLLFEEDAVYIVYGNRNIYLTQLKPDLSEPMPGGLHRLLVSDEGNPNLGYEGSHLYRINGKYYLFLIHSLPDHWRRVEACFMADSLTDPFTGGDVLDDDMGYCEQGVAQGGIVDTPRGDWYGILFQDSGAVGRIPVLIPITWKKNFPVFGVSGKIPKLFPMDNPKPDYTYQPLVDSDDFKVENCSSEALRRERYGCFGFRSMWQFNHEPNLSLIQWDKEAGNLSITTGKISPNVTYAQNTLTQRMKYPFCAGEITVDGSGLQEGDYAGICALQGCYGLVAVTRRKGRLYVVMISREAKDASLDVNPTDDWLEQEWEEIPMEGSVIRLKVEAEFTNMKDQAAFFYQAAGGWRKIGKKHKLYFKLDHFTGCRFGLFVYSTRQTGGTGTFRDFAYQM